jgi:hypothetical protein
MAARVKNSMIPGTTIQIRNCRCRLDVQPKQDGREHIHDSSHQGWEYEELVEEFPAARKARKEFTPDELEALLQGGMCYGRLYGQRNP